MERISSDFGLRMFTRLLPVLNVVLFSLLIFPNSTLISATDGAAGFSYQPYATA